MATNTYVALDKKTVLTNSSSIEFTGISSAYTHLVLECQYGSSDSADYLQMRFNSDANTNYSTTSMNGNGSNAQDGRSTNRTEMFVDWNSSCENALTKATEISIFNYTSTAYIKPVVIRGNRATSSNPTYTGVELQGGLWRKTPEAITSILFKMATGNILAGSTFNLYGISNVAGDATAKAVGGEVFSDSTYFYHVFKGAGTFAPLQSLTADILVVAGGGGTSGAGGGSGAGGLLGFSSQSLTVQNYPVIVGAGGSRGTTVDVYPTNGNNSKFGTLTTALGGAYGAGYMGGPNYVSAGSGGGSGGGGAYNAQGQYSSGTAGQGYDGNNGYQASGGGDPRSGGGGGGAGGAATNGGVANTGATGGIGSSAYSSWLSACGLGQNSGGTYYIAGGGGGAGKQNGGPGGLGGGTAGTRSEGTLQTLVAAAPNTGSGSGSSGDTYTGVNGGSGLVIVRYTKA